MTLQRFLHRFRRAFVVGGAFAVAGAFAPGASAADVGVSIQVGQPGFYGRIDIGNAPRPVLVYPEPVIVQPAPVAVVRRPIYLRVPPGHVKKWSKHCHRYAACGQPVYFVQDRWYEEVYVPHHRRVRHTERHYVRERIIERERVVERAPRGRHEARGKGRGNNDRGRRGRD